MRGRLLLVFLLVAACGPAATNTQGPGATPGPQGTAAGPGATGPAATSPGGAATAGNGAAIPASCAAGFTDYLQLIEPVVSGFDPATSKYGDFFAAKSSAGEKGVEAMMENGGVPTYSCSEVGLEFGYFDSRSPWDAVLALANQAAPGTVKYLETARAVSAIDVGAMADYGATSCDDAVTKIQAGVSGATAGGLEHLADMPVAAGLTLAGLYHTYLAQVREGACPPDVLGNDEFDFMGALG